MSYSRDTFEAFSAALMKLNSADSMIDRFGLASSDIQHVFGEDCCVTFRRERSVASQAGSLAIVVERERPFTDDEQVLLDELQAHLAEVAAERGECLSRSGPELRAHYEHRTREFRRLREKGLTLRECEVAFWVSEGKRDAEIATIVGARPGTIARHVRNLMRKLGVCRRMHAAGRAAEWLRRSSEPP